MSLTARHFLPIKTALGYLEISARRSSETNGSIQNADGMYPQIKHDTSSSSDDARGILCSPYSHFWYLRSGARASSAARSCVMPQRARRSASWVAVSDKGPFGPARFGWLGMSGLAVRGPKRPHDFVGGLTAAGPRAVDVIASGAADLGAVALCIQPCGELLALVVVNRDFDGMGGVGRVHDDLLSDGAVAPFDLDGLDGAVGGVGVDHDGFALAVSHQDLDLPIQKLGVLFDGNDAALSDHCSRLTKVLAGDAIPDAGADVVADCCDLFDVHGVSSAPVIPRRGGQRFAVHVSNVAPKRRSVKRYLQRFETVTSWGAA